jgi:phage terminase large subunit
MNSCFNGRYGFDLEIDEGCKHLIGDLQYVREDANGAKEKLKAEINGVMCEKYGHHSDSMDYFVCWGEFRK